MERMLIRMVMLLRRPPSRRTIMVALFVIAVAAVLYGIESAGYWPEWATSDRMGRRGNAIRVGPVE